MLTYFYQSQNLKTFLKKATGDVINHNLNWGFLPSTHQLINYRN